MHALGIWSVCAFVSFVCVYVDCFHPKHQTESGAYLSIIQTRPLLHSHPVF